MNVENLQFADAPEITSCDFLSGDFEGGSTTWPKVRLGDYVNLLAGFPFKSQQFTDNPNDIALVKGENVSQGCILWGISKRWSVSDWEKMEKFHLLPGDVVIAMDRPWIPAGLKWSFIRVGDPKSLLVQRCARLRSNNSLLDQNFLRFVIGSPSFENYVKPITTGVNVPHISGQQILDFEFTLPPLPVQRRIAGILSAYDELIENSQRRIRILEEMARSLYREWFVHFRFPGHENVPLVSSSLGDIPQGWEVVQLSSLVDYAKGRKPAETRPTQKLGDVKLLLIDSLHGGTPVFTSPAKLVLADIRDTIMVMDGASSCDVTIGSTGAVGSTLGRFRTTRSDVFSAHALYRFLEAKAEDFKSKNIGAAIPHANKDYILTQHIPLPPKTIASNFQVQLEPIQKSIETLKSQIQNLHQTRDLLLPRLLSGQMELNSIVLSI